MFKSIIAACLVSVSALHAADWNEYPQDPNVLNVRTGQIYELTIAGWQRQDVTGNTRFSWTSTYDLQTGLTEVTGTTPEGRPFTNFVAAFTNIVDVDVFPAYLTGGFVDGGTALKNGPLPAMFNSMRGLTLDPADFVDITQMDGTTATDFHFWTVSNLINDCNGLGGVNTFVAGGGAPITLETQGVFDYGSSITGLFTAYTYDGALWKVLDRSHFIKSWGSVSSFLPMWLFREDQLLLLPDLDLPVVQVVHDADTNTSKTVALTLTGLIAGGSAGEDVTIDYSGSPVSLTELYWGEFLDFNGIEIDFTVVNKSGSPTAGDQIAFLYPNIKIYVPWAHMPMWASTNFFFDYHCVLDSMRWTAADVTWSAEGQNNRSIGSGSGGNWNSADVQANLDFANTGSPSDAAPRQITTHASAFNSSAETRYAFATATGVNQDFEHVFELWAVASGTDTFDDNGTISIAQNDEWTKLFTSAPTFSGGITSSLIGDASLAIGNFPAASPDINIGYIITDAQFIVKWDQPGSDFLFK